MDMIIKKVTLESGQEFFNVPANTKQLLELGVLPEKVALIMKQAANISKALETKNNQRVDIELSAGDTASILGTTADGMQLLLHSFSHFIVKINSAQSLDDVRNASNDFMPIAQTFLAKVDSGEVKMPFNVRGIDETMDKINTRATSVANILAAQSV